MPLILGIESTCDETAAAVVENGTRVLSNVVASQAAIHAVYQGVVPEIAARAHIESLLPVLTEACATAGVRAADVDAIAVAHRPGLIGSLLVGVTAAKTLAWSLGKPLIAVDHVRAHLYSVMLDPVGGLSFPHALRLTPLPSVGLVCSGGHTALYDVQSWRDVTLIGSTIDDAVGEAYDKVATILGLGYPGGPILDTLAAQGDPKAIDFPRSRLGESLDFSFSGLKTSVLYHVRGHKGRERPPGSVNDAERADIAASFQQACIDILVLKLRRALARTNARGVIVGGGVSANHGLRAALAHFDVPAYFPEPAYCTDNAAMIAGLGYVMFAAGQFSDLSLDASPGGEIAMARRET